MSNRYKSHKQHTRKFIRLFVTMHVLVVVQKLLPPLSDGYIYNTHTLFIEIVHIESRTLLYKKRSKRKAWIKFSLRKYRKFFHNSIPYTAENVVDSTFVAILALYDSLHLYIAAHIQNLL